MNVVDDGVWNGGKTVVRMVQVIHLLHYALLKEC